MLMKKYTHIVFRMLAAGLFGVFVLAACNESEDPETPEQWLKKQLAKVDQTKLESDIAVIEDSLERWNLTSQAQAEPKGVRYVISQAGTGETPTLRSTIVIKYTGKFLSTGEVFDEDDNFTYPLTYLIAGWQTTLPLLKVGTKATLFIPSGLAYGPSGATDNTGAVVIPPDMNLIFEIELLDVY